MLGDAISQILTARDKQLSGLNKAIDRIHKEIEGYTRNDDYLTRLYARRRDLNGEADAVTIKATNEILELPEVVKARATLVSLGEKMEKTADEMVKVKNFLVKSTEVLSVAKKFVDIITEKQKRPAAAGG